MPVKQLVGVKHAQEGISPNAIIHPFFAYLFMGERFFF
jgi:hypothetical protein